MDKLATTTEAKPGKRPGATERKGFFNRLFASGKTKLCAATVSAVLLATACGDSNLLSKSDEKPNGGNTTETDNSANQYSSGGEFDPANLNSSAEITAAFESAKRRLRKANHRRVACRPRYHLKRTLNRG